MLTGGPGADLFVYQNLYPSDDRILDFNPAEGDRIDFSAVQSVNQFSDLAILDDGQGKALLVYGESSIVLDRTL